MSDGEFLFYLWLSGFILCLPIMIRWSNYKELDGRTVVDLRKVIIILCGAVIGNWGIVAIYLWGAGMWLVVKIGEWLSHLGDITFYSDAPPKGNKNRGKN